MEPAGPPIAEVLSDARERRRAAGAEPEDRRGRLLVEAAAGTGKTTVLLARVLATVESGDRPLSEIAVVTFTEQAAAELKLRLRREIGARLRHGTDPALAPRLRQALSDLETAAVGTIHSFCLDLLRQRPVEAGVDPAFTVADPFTRRLLRTRAWELLLERVGEEAPGLAAAFDLGIVREPELRRLAFALAGADRRRLPPPLGEEELDLDRRWSATGAELDCALGLSEPGGALHRNLLSAVRAFAALDRLPRRELARALLAGDLKVSRLGGKGSEAEAKAARDRAVEALAALTADLAHQRLARLAAWLTESQEIYQELTRRAGCLDFDQLIERTVEMLEGKPEVLADFRARYPVVLVDEFQDTDAVQVRLLLTLAGGPALTGAEPAAGHQEADGRREDAAGRACSLFLVGDPKQSIYRFRGADLETYSRVEASFGADRRIVLSQSFRPLPALAAWVNRVLGRVMEGASAPFEARYEALGALPVADPHPESGVAYLELAPPEGARVGDVRLAEAEALARLARHLVASGEALVREAGARRPPAWGDLLLLLPKMPMLEDYEQAFHRFDVPFRVVGGRHYFRRDEVHALLQVLSALADPGDPVAVVSALRGPGFGCSDEALLAYALLEPRPRFDTVPAPDLERRLAASPAPAAAAEVAQCLALLRELRRAVEALPLPDAVVAVLDSTGLLPFFALRHRGEQRVANLLKVVEVARRVEASGGARSLSAFVRWLEVLLEEEPEESDSPYLEGSGQVMRVMTIHKAKGLESPIVLLGGLAGGRSQGGGLQVLPAEDGGLALRLSKERGTRGFQEAAERDAARERAEDKRLLYVAVTRARDLLVLPWAPGVERKNLHPVFAELYAEGVGRPEDVAGLARSIAAADLPAPFARVSASRVELDRLHPGRGGRLAAERQAWEEERQRRTRAVAPSARPSTPPVAGPAAATARAIGQRAHELLAAALAPGASPGPRPGRPAAAFADDLPAGLEEPVAVGVGPLAPAEEAAAAALAARFLASPLAARARAAADRLVEIPFAVALDPGPAATGRIDLAFREADGWVLVDYKTDRVDPATLPAHAAAHTPQLALYARALAKITQQPIAEASLFFLAIGEVVSFRGDELAGLMVT